MNKKVKPKARLKQTTNIRSARRQTNKLLIVASLESVYLLLVINLIVVVDCAPSANSTTGGQTGSESFQLRSRQPAIGDLRQYHVNLPKVGPISGLIIDPWGPETSSAKDGEGKQEVVGFLGIPYAAPPIGPLRFMPPGAIQLQQQQQLYNYKPQRLVVAPNGQRVLVRLFDRLGASCVHLADWLNHSDGSSNDRQHDNNQEQFLLPSDGKHKDEERLQQSEDCLNLNVFVPTRESNEKEKRKQSVTGQSNSISGQLEKSDRPDQANGEQPPAHNDQSGHQKTTDVKGGAEAEKTAQPSRLVSDGHSRKLPILVVMKHRSGGQRAPNRAKTMMAGHQSDIILQEQAKIALRTDSIVITFNYRTGLLGFLPYVDDDETGNSKSRRQSQAARYNYAIWDQIGLLHWIRRNVQAFGGDPNNVTLVAVDNSASLHLQLLCMSPLAKGLFSRAILLQHRQGCISADGSLARDQVNLDQLIEVAGRNGIELRRSLSNSLADIVSRHMNLRWAQDFTTSTQQQQPINVYEALLSADIYQLAQIDYKLGQKLSSKMQLLIDEPSLDDTLLFPHLGPLIDYLRGGASRLRLVQSELNYCSYIRRMYLTNSSSDHLDDPLQLIPLPVSTIYQSKNWTLRSNDSAGWHKELASEHNRKLGRLSKLADQQGSASRSMAVQYFNHLNHLSSLSRLFLSNTSQHHSTLSTSTIDEQIDEANNYGDEHHQTIQMVPTGDQRMGRIRRKDSNIDDDDLREPSRGKPVSELQAIGDTNYLAELLSSIDIMFGYISCSRPLDDEDKIHHYLRQQKIKGNNLSRISESLLSILANNSSDLVDNDLVIWLKWLDFHSILSSLELGDTISSRYCDFNVSSSSSLRAGLRSAASGGSSFVFMVVDEADEADISSSNIENQSVILKTMNASARIELGVKNFIRSGNAKGDERSSWPNYGTLNREFETNRLTETDYKSIRDTIVIELDMLPYLNDELPKSVKTGENLNENATSSSLHNSYNCLSELAGPEVVKGKCLANSVAKFRNLTRRYAAQDLKPLILRLKTSNNASNQVWDYGPERGSRTSSAITTRNLVNQLADMVNEIGNSDEQQSDDNHSFIVTNGSGLVGRQLADHLPRSATNDNNQLLSKLFGLSTTATGTKQSHAGKALTIVVATGLVIFLVNLIIVIVMALRSSRQRRRASNNSCAQTTGSLSTNELHHLGADSGGQQKSIVGIKPILQQQQHQAAAEEANDQSLFENYKESPMKLASSLRKTSSSSGGDAKSISRQTKTKQLKFNLANDDDQASPEVVQGSPLTNCFHRQMLELDELNCDQHAIDNRIASPLLSLDVSQYLVAPNYHGHSEDCAIYHQHQHQHQHQRLHQHRHHHRHHHHSNQSTTIDLNQYIVPTNKNDILQSPFNQSLATASQTTSSTFRQTGSSSGSLGKPQLADRTIISSQPRHDASTICDNHSLNSSTTLSMTPNQQTTESSTMLAFSQPSALDYRCLSNNCPAVDSFVYDNHTEQELMNAANWQHKFSCPSGSQQTHTMTKNINQYKERHQ